MDKRQLRNTFMLVLCAFIWGTAFVAQSVGGNFVGPYTFLASRSWLACIFLASLLLIRRFLPGRSAAVEAARRAHTDKRALFLGGTLCGVMLFFASIAQQIGIGTTTTAKAGFLTALYVLLVPVLGIFAGRRPALRVWVCVGISLVGLYLLCLAGKSAGGFSKGEWLLLLCALLFTFQILLVSHFSPKADGVALSLMEFLATAILSTLCMFLFEHPTPEMLRSAAFSIFYCGIFSSGVAYTLQILGQKELDPTVASLAMCLESVFSALAGWVLLGQQLSPAELLGCCLMFSAIVGAQLPGRHRAAPPSGKT